MADSRDLARAQSESKLKLCPSEEQVMYKYLVNIDRKIWKIESEKREVRSLYELD